MTKTIPKQFSREFLKELLPADAIIVEAGAHIGRDTVKLAQLFPQGTIHAFEPHPQAFESLKNTVQQLPNVECYNIALSNKTGRATFYVSTDIRALSSLHEPTRILEERPTIAFDQITVDTITLDQWATTYAVPRVDFIWLDTQGHELAILQGAENLLPHIKALFIEVNIEQRYKDQPLYHEIKKYMEEHGFKVLLEHLHHGTWGNVLFIS